MSIARRSARTVWQGPLATGSGEVTSGSGALTDLEVTWAARIDQPAGKSSPEELAAGAHSSCFSMALALKLAEHGNPPQRLDVDATVILDAVDGLPTIVSSALRVTGQVAGIDAEQFRQVVDEAGALCPVSRLFAGAQITLAAVLEPVSTT